MKVAARPRWRLQPGVAISTLVVVAASMAGALVFPLSTLGRATPGSASKEWLLLLAGTWALLVVWAMLYTLLLSRLLGLSAERALYWTAISQTPLLLCIGLPAALYTSDLSNHMYSNSAYGQVVFRPLARGYVLLAPALTQILMLAAHRRRSLASAFPIAAVAAVALGLRLWNLDWGLPALYHPDEHRYIGRALNMLRTGDLNPHYFQNPGLSIYIDYALAALLSPQVQPFHLVIDFFRLGVQDLRGDYLVDLGARAASALAGTLTVLVVFLVGRRQFGRAAGLFAASLLAVSFLHVRNSHYATNDVLATFFLTTSFLFSVRISTQGHISDYLLAGLFGGLGTGAKYNAAFFGVAILVAHVARPRRSELGIWSLRHHLPLVASGLISLAAFLASNPFVLLDFAGFSADFRTQFGYGASPWAGQDTRPTTLLYLLALGKGLGWLPLALAAVGAALAIRRHRLAFILLASVPTTYLLFMFSQKLFFVRFAIPLLPFLALLAGYALHQLEHPSSAGRWRRAVALLLLAAALAQPLLLSGWHNVLLGRDDTRTLAAHWLEDNVPPDSLITVESHAWMSSPFQWGGSRPRDLSLFRPEEPADVAEVLRGDFDYVVVSSLGYWSWDRASDPSSGVTNAYRSLDRRGRLVVVFQPGKNNTEIPYDVDEINTPFWHLTDRQRPGPSIRIYRVSTPG